MWENIKDFIMVYFTLVVFILLMFICLLVYVGFKILRKFEKEAQKVSQLHSNVMKDSESLQTIVINLHSEFYTVKKTDLDNLIAKHVKLHLQEENKKILKDKIKQTKDKNKINGIDRDIYSKEMKEIKIIDDDDGISIIKAKKEEKEDSDKLKETRRVISLDKKNPKYVTGWFNRAN